MKKSTSINSSTIENSSIKSAIAAFLLLCIVAINPASAVIEAVEFDSPEQQVRYQSLIAELRCMVCQNQNLADSDADLAKDLRSKTLLMLKEGKSDKEILEFMRVRYGDFVLYRPPLNLRNAVLWLGPFLLLFIVFIMIIRKIKQQSNQDKAETKQTNTVNAAALAKAEQALSQQDNRSTK